MSKNARDCKRYRFAHDNTTESGENMEYQIGEFAQLAGITTRTLRYYDKIGLLKPVEVTEAGYRIYDSSQVDLLQQILFFRELDLSLEEIQTIVLGEDFGITKTLEGHLQTLKEREKRMNHLISLVEKSIQHQKGELIMTDTEKFEALKKQIITENEEKYGAEIREKYGADTIDQSNRKMMGLSEQEMKAMNDLQQEIGEKLALACQQGDPKSPLATEVAVLHKQWLDYSWSSYSREKHLGLVAMYRASPEFTKFYDAYGVGCTEFLATAVEHWLA